MKNVNFFDYLGIGNPKLSVQQGLFSYFYYQFDSQVVCKSRDAHPKPVFTRCNARRLILNSLNTTYASSKIYK